MGKDNRKHGSYLNVGFAVLIIILLMIAAYFSLLSEDEDTPYRTGEEIDWKDYAKATSLAKSSGKPVLVNFHGDGSIESQKMDNETFTNKALIRLSEDFECAKVNVEEERSLAEQHRANNIQVILFLTPDGEEIRRFMGFLDATMLIEEMKNVKRTVEAIQEGNTSA